MKTINLNELAEFINQKYFQNKIKNVFVIPTHAQNVKGYFLPDSWQIGNDVFSEIAIAAESMTSLTDFLACLIHELIHAYQHAVGTESEIEHNKEFIEMAKSLGLRILNPEGKEEPAPYVTQEVMPEFQKIIDEIPPELIPDIMPIKTPGSPESSTPIIIHIDQTPGSTAQEAQAQNQDPENTQNQEPQDNKPKKNKIQDPHKEEKEEQELLTYFCPQCLERILSPNPYLKLICGLCGRALIKSKN